MAKSTTTWCRPYRRGKALSTPPLIRSPGLSIRGSDVDAALYYMGRMLYAGEDPLAIARRVVVCAAEDVGLADPHALPTALAAFHACQVIGMPEADLMYVRDSETH